MKAIPAEHRCNMDETSILDGLVMMALRLEAQRTWGTAVTLGPKLLSLQRRLRLSKDAYRGYDNPFEPGSVEYKSLGPSVYSESPTSVIHKINMVARKHSFHESEYMRTSCVPHFIYRREMTWPVPR